MKRHGTTLTFLGKGTDFDGNITIHTDIRIEGQFKGEILVYGTLIVGEEGMIEANIHATYIVVCGEIHGNIVADHGIEIRVPGKVFGNIQAPCLSIDEGGIFEGNCRMHQVEEADERELDVIGPDPSRIDPLPCPIPRKSDEDPISEAHL